MKIERPINAWAYAGANPALIEDRGSTEAIGWLGGVQPTLSLREDRPSDPPYV
jgi:hypothetical protein